MSSAGTKGEAMESEALWDRIKKGILDSASTAVDKAERLGRLGRAHLDVAETRHTIHEKFAQLGGVVYDLLEQNQRTGIAQRKDVKALLQELKALDVLLKQREARLEALKGGAEGA